MLEFAGRVVEMNPPEDNPRRRQGFSAGIRDLLRDPDREGPHCDQHHRGLFRHQSRQQSFDIEIVRAAINQLDIAINVRVRFEGRNQIRNAKRGIDPYLAATAFSGAILLVRRIDEYQLGFVAHFLISASTLSHQSVKSRLPASVTKVCRGASKSAQFAFQQKCTFCVRGLTTHQTGTDSWRPRAG